MRKIQLTSFTNFWTSLIEGARVGIVSRTIRIGVVACAALLAISLPAIGSASTVVSPNLMIGTQGLTLQSQQSLSNGLVETTWGVGSNQVTVEGPTGTTVSAQSTGSTTAGGSGSIVAEIQPPPISATTTGIKTYTPAQAPSIIYGELLNLGATTSVATEMAQSIAPAGVTVTSSTLLSASSQLNAVIATPATTIPAGTIFYSTCDRVTGDAGNAYGYACLVQKMMQNNSYGTYVGDTITTSGSDQADPYDSLSSLISKDYYTYTGSSGTHSIVQWKPINTLPVGSPQTVTEGLSYNGFGISVSQEEYPGTLTPDLSYPSGSSYTGFGSTWTGCDGSDVLAAPSTDVASVSSGGSVDAGVVDGISWALIC